jgi:hypothetical protein
MMMNRAAKQKTTSVVRGEVTLRWCTDGEIDPTEAEGRR